MPFARLRLAALCAAVFLIDGCSLYVPGEPGVPRSRRRSSHDVGRHPSRVEVVGRSVLGAPIRAHVFGSGSETLLMLGAVHGNEPLTRVVLDELVERLAAARPPFSGQRLVVVPVLNPDGLARGSRYNARGVDLNRNFPARNWRAGRRHGSRPRSEPETAVVIELIRRYRPSRILAVHSPLHCVNYDGPAGGVARRMAIAMRYPLKPSIGYPTPGSLGSYAGHDLGVPIVTLELRNTTRASEAWRDAKPGLVAFIRGEPRPESYAGRGIRASSG